MKKFLLVLFPAFLISCSTVQVVDTENSEEVSDMQNVMQLEYRDWDSTANKMVKSMLDSGRLNKKDGTEYVLAIGRITNDTMQRIDTDLLLKKIRTQLLNSGKVQISTAVLNEDTMTNKVRNLRNNDEYDANTIVSKGTLIAPELSLTGKIIQRNIEESRKDRVEYYFQMTLTNIKTGLSIWENEEPIIKRGGSVPTW